jgi:hypothetical protein
VENTYGSLGDVVDNRKEFATVRINKRLVPCAGDLVADLERVHERGGTRREGEVLELRSRQSLVRSLKGSLSGCTRIIERDRRCGWRDGS